MFLRAKERLEGSARFRSDGNLIQPLGRRSSRAHEGSKPGRRYARKRRSRSLGTCYCGRTGERLGRMQPRPLAWPLARSRSRSARHPPYWETPRAANRGRHASGPSLALVAFDEAGDERLRGEYTLTDANRVPPDWQGGTGRVDAEMIAKAVPDYRERTFYLSGPRPLVVSFEEVLRNIGIRKGRIKTDFFPGFA